MKQNWKSLAYLNLGLGILLISVYCMFFYKADLVFDVGTGNSTVLFFTDSIDGGASTIHKSSVKNGNVEMQCILRDAFAYPYTGMEIEVPNGKSLDITAYNTLELKLRAENITNLFVYFHVKEKNIKDTLNRLVLRRVYNDLQVTGKDQIVEMPISQFTTPNWWYELVHQPKSDFGNPDLKNLKSLSITTGVNTKREELITIKVYSIVFKKDNTLWISVFAFIQAMFAGLSILYSYLSKKSNKVSNTIEISYKPVLIAENPTEKEPEYLTYIHSNYDNPDLTLTLIAQSTGISQRIISEGISEKFECNVKTYINRVRIHEAKRLLLNSPDLNINEIAYKVGFNSSANFNRVFKSITAKNPSEFLQEAKGHS